MQSEESLIFGDKNDNNNMMIVMVMITMQLFITNVLTQQRKAQLNKNIR